MSDEIRFRKSKEEIDSWRGKLCQLTCDRGSILTKTLIKSMELNPDYLKDYNYFMEQVFICRRMAIKKWISFKHLYKDNVIIFKKYKEYLFENGIPLIFFDKTQNVGYFPQNYEQMEFWVGSRVVSEFERLMGILKVAEIADMKLLSGMNARDLFNSLERLGVLFYKPPKNMRAIEKDITIRSITYVSEEKICANCGELSMEELCPKCGAPTI